MNLDALLDKLPFLARVNDLLVVESDIAGIRGVVFVRQGNALSQRYEASANYDDFSDGLKTLISELRNQGWQGEQAVLLNPAVVSSIITLPIPPKHKLSPQQVAEQVSWEMEPLVSQRARELSIGGLLVQQGLMTTAQVEEVLSLQNEANSSQQRDKLYKKFGEQAQLLSYVKRIPLESTLRRQAWFKASGEALHCGFRGLSAVPVEGGFQWLATAVSKPLLRQWQVAFLAAGIKLHGCFPLAGSSLGVAGLNAAVPNAASQQNAVLFEVHTHFIAMAYVQNKQLMQLQSMPIQAHEALAAMSDFLQLLDIAQPESLQVLVVDATKQAPSVAEVWLSDVTSVLSLPVRALTANSALGHAGLQGAARMVMQMQPWVMLTELPIGEPAPVWYKRPEFKVGAAVALMLAVMLVAEASLWVRIFIIHSEKSTVDVQLAKQRAAIAAVQKQIDTVNQLKTKIATDEASVAKLKKSLLLLEYELPKRNQSLVDLLQAFEDSVSDDVVVDSLTEDSRLGFSIQAWALDEAAAQEFAKRFQVHIHNADYRIKDSTVSEQTGRLGLLGYAIKFKATTLSDNDWQAAKLASNPLLANAGKK